MVSRSGSVPIRPRRQAADGWLASPQEDEAPRRASDWRFNLDKLLSR